jgi:hypothetical protein
MHAIIEPSGCAPSFRKIRACTPKPMLLPPLPARQRGLQELH